MIRNGVSLSRSVELTVQWDCVLWVGLVPPISLDDLQSVRGVDIGDFFRVVGVMHSRLSDFVHRVVFHRRDEALRGVAELATGGSFFVHPYQWLRADFVLPAPFLQCEPRLTPGESGVLADPARIDEEFRKPWLPHFCRCGQKGGQP